MKNMIQGIVSAVLFCAVSSSLFFHLGVNYGESRWAEPEIQVTEVQPSNIADAEDDLASADSMAEMIQAVGGTYTDADAEMDRVYGQIYQVYEDDPLFLEWMKKAQQIWVKQRETDFLMMFPCADNPDVYGAEFGLDGSRYLSIQAKQRTAYLKRWLIGVHREEGDAWKGSIKSRAHLQQVLGEAYPGYPDS